MIFIPVYNTIILPKTSVYFKADDFKGLTNHEPVQGRKVIFLMEKERLTPDQITETSFYPIGVRAEITSVDSQGYVTVQTENRVLIDEIYKVSDRDFEFSLTRLNDNDDLAPADEAAKLAGIKESMIEFSSNTPWGENAKDFINSISSIEQMAVAASPWLAVSNEERYHLLEIDSRSERTDELEKMLYEFSETAQVQNDAARAQQEDYKKLSNKMVGYYSIMASDLDDYITQGERYVSPSHKRAFKELSAVITNEKKIGDEYERFWYMLPLLKERHVPDLCISRVCGESPETLFVNQQSGNEIIVDANFITLWNPNHNDQVLGFALLNSTWAKLFLEVTGTVMGGGALKLEASHVRKMIFPKIRDEMKLELEIIGKEIIESKRISKKLQNQIDDIVATSFGEKNKDAMRDQLEKLLTRKIQERTGRKK